MTGSPFGEHPVVNIAGLGGGGGGAGGYGTGGPTWGPRFGRLFRGLRRRWFSIVVVAAGLAAAGVWAIQTHYRPAYRAGAVVQVRPAPQQPGADSAGRSATLFAGFVATQRSLLKSPPVLRAALEDPRLRGRPSLTAAPDPLDALDRRVTVHGGEGQLIDISSDSPDPAEARDIVNAVVDAYLAGGGRGEDARIDAEAEAVSMEREKLAGELRDRQRELFEFAKTAGRPDDEGRQAAVAAALKDLQDRISRLDIGVAETRARVRSMEALTDDDIVRPVPGEVEAVVAADPLVRQWESSLGEMKGPGLVKLRQVYTDSSPEVRNYRAQIAGLDRALTERRRRLIETAGASLVDSKKDAHRRKLAEGRDALARGEAELKEVRGRLADRQAEAAAMSRDLAELNRRRTLRDSAKERLDAAEKRLAALDAERRSLRIGSVTVLSRAETPTAPHEDLTRPLYAAAGVGSLAVALGLALLRHLLDGRLHDPREVSSAAAGLAVLGTIREPRGALEGRLPWPGRAARREQYRQLQTGLAALLDVFDSLGIRLVCVSVGSPYYNPHFQRPALFPPSDGYLPPEDPLVGVARQLDITARLKRHRPGLVIVGSGYSYLQEWLPNVGQAAVRTGGVDFVGLGRMVLSYPDLPADVLAGRPLQRKKICRTFSDCTTAPRNGLVSGCFPLDPFYKALPEAAEVAKLRPEKG